MKTHDLLDRSDIETLVNSFYEKIRSDELLGFIFNDVADIDWPAHLPKMYDFSETVIYSKINGVRDPRFDLTDEQRARYAKYRENPGA